MENNGEYYIFIDAAYAIQESFAFYRQGAYCFQLDGKSAIEPSYATVLY